MTTAARKLRNADETLASAEKAVGRARSGLHAAEEVVVKAEQVKKSPLAMTMGVFLVATIVGAIIVIMRDD